MRCYQVVILSLPLTIGRSAVTPTPVASPPITALPMPAIYAPPNLRSLPSMKSSHPGMDADLPVERQPVVNLSTRIDLLRHPLPYRWVRS